MPIVYQVLIPIRVNGDMTIDILTRLKEEVKKCGCVDIVSAATRMNASVDDAQLAAKRLAGDEVIACDSEGKYCCTDLGRLDSFLVALKSLRGD